MRVIMSAMKMGYESWSPKDTFEKAYKIAETPVDRMQIEAEEVNGRYVKVGRFHRFRENG